MKLTTGKALLAGCIAMAMSRGGHQGGDRRGDVRPGRAVWRHGVYRRAPAIADINAKGGIKGDKLVGVEYDDACDPKQAVAVANKVINDGIRYVIGHLCSSSTQPASDIYEDEGVIMTPAATNADLTTRGYKMILRTTGRTRIRARPPPNTFSRHRRSASPWCTTSSNTVKARPARCATAPEKQGTEVAMFEGITAGDKDFSTRWRA